MEIWFCEKGLLTFMLPILFAIWLIMVVDAGIIAATVIVIVGIIATILIVSWGMWVSDNI